MRIFDSYSLVAVGALTLLTIGIVTSREAGTKGSGPASTQVAACDATNAPSGN